MLPLPPSSPSLSPKKKGSKSTCNAACDKYWNSPTKRTHKLGVCRSASSGSVKSGRLVQSGRQRSQSLRLESPISITSTTEQQEEGEGSLNGSLSTDFLAVPSIQSPEQQRRLTMHRLSSLRTLESRQRVLDSDAEHDAKCFTKECQENTMASQLEGKIVPVGSTSVTTSLLCDSACSKSTETKEKTNGSVCPKKQMHRESSIRKLKCRQWNGRIEAGNPKDLSKTTFAEDISKQTETFSKSDAENCGPSFNRQGSPTNTKASRRVTFSETDAIYQLPDTSSISKEDIWYNSEEMSGMEERARITAGFFAQYRTEYVSAACRLIAECARSSAANTSTTDLALRNDDFLRMVVDDATRGLEVEIISLLHTRQKRSIKCVMQTQEQQSQDGKGNEAATTKTTSEACSRLVSLKYKRASQYASVWARLLAEGDAMNVFNWKHFG